MKRTIYGLSWSKTEKESHIEEYFSFFEWIRRILQLLYKEDTSVLIYKPHSAKNNYSLWHKYIELDNRICGN